MGQGPIELKQVPQPQADEIEPGAKFPMHVHSEDGETFKVVNSDEELTAAKAEGWKTHDAKPEVNEPVADDAKADKPKAAAKTGRKK